MSKKILSILILVLTLSFTTEVFASLTFTTDAITGTTDSSIDLGAGNALSLQTIGNGNIVTGTGNFGIGTMTPGFLTDIQAGTETRSKILNLEGTLDGSDGSTDYQAISGSFTLSGNTNIINNISGGYENAGLALNVINNISETVYGSGVSGIYSKITNPVGIHNSNLHGAWIRSEQNNSSGTNTGIKINTITDNTSGNTNQYGLFITSDGSGVGGAMYKNYGTLSGANATNGTTTDLIGVDGQISVSAGTTVTNAAFLTAGRYYNSFGVSPIFGGTTSNLYGLWIPTISKSGGTVTTAYGAHISTPTAGTTNYPLYVEGLGTSYFAGKIGIGTTTPGSKLSVVGLPVYADNTAALGGGLVTGDVYRTATGVLMVTY